MPATATAIRTLLPTVYPAPLRRTRGPSPQKTEITRFEILQAALAEFMEVGIARATMDRIAKRAHLAKGTLYAHFGSKEALLQGAMEATISQSLLANLHQSPSPGERIQDFITRIVVPSIETFHTTGRAELARLVLGEARRSPQLARFYHEQVFSPWIRYFEQLMQQAVHTGELQGIAPATAARLLGAPFWISMVQETIETTSTPGCRPADLMRAQIQVLFQQPASA